jgi:hypothetical protein
MVESALWGLLCGDITSDTVLNSGEISRRMEIRMGSSGRSLGFGQRCPKSVLASKVITRTED